MGVGVAVASVALGASVIEKHFTLARADGGVDSAFSLEPEEMESLVVETERAWQALGKIRYGPTDAERNSLVFRRSIYVSRDISAGELFDETNIKIVRPGHGLPPLYFEHLLGKKSPADIKVGSPITFDDLFGGLQS